MEISWKSPQKYHCVQELVEGRWVGSAVGSRSRSGEAQEGHLLRELIRVPWK